MLEKKAKIDRKTSIERLLCCPYCKSDLIKEKQGFQCINSECDHHKRDAWFKILDGKPILISEYCDTVCNAEDVKSLVGRRKDDKFKEKLNDLLNGRPIITEVNCSKFIKLLDEKKTTPRCLIIGSGEQGRGAEALSMSNIPILGTDVYFTNNVDVVSDAHYLPFKDQAFDGVWIQAVLEHVVEPQVVINEIYRVLKDEGIVYAETPFMQQVHEAAFDFTRFTVLGHRFLFKRFDAIEIGGDKGVAVVLTWAIKYFFWAIFRSKKLATLISMPFGILLRFFEKFTDNKSLYDASSGVYFLGRKTDKIISHKDLIGLYKGMQK